MGALLPAHAISVIRVISELGEAERVSVYLVGGTIRDLLLELGPIDRDLDFIIEGDSAKFARLLAEKIGAHTRAFPQFLTAKVENISGFGPIRELDFVSARSEVYPAPGALPQVLPGTLEKDLKRRDFTINSLAVSLPALLKVSTVPELRCSIIDMTLGLVDLEKRCLRTLHASSFLDDPTRIFRGCRYAARMHGSFAKETECELYAALEKGALATISHVRILNEIRKILGEREAAVALELLSNYGVLKSQPLFNQKGLSLLCATLRKLSAYEIVATDELRYEVGLRLFYASFDSSERDRVFSAWKFGKRQMKVLAQDVDSATPGQLSDAGALFHWLRYDRPEMRQRLVARGIIQS